ncbi:Uncharacterised protein [Mycobacteroides abscessus subsp. abscessus]|nr:Uncharacterised protein [Mycobacteroides abscessus subsp. abscessus]
MRVSKSRPNAIVVPTCPMMRRSLTTMTAMVKAKTSPAEVTTLPVPPIERMMPVFRPPCSSSLSRETNNRL